VADLNRSAEERIPVKPPPEKIVADGEQRLWKAKDYFAVRGRIVREVKERYAQEFDAAPPFRRFAIWFRVHREVRTRMKKEFPVGALYLHRAFSAEEPIQPPLPTRAAVPSATSSPRFPDCPHSARAADL
jgi:hypothetical protein